MVARFRSADRQMIRGINQALVLGAIRQHGPVSRTDIAELTRLSPATVSGITAELIDQDVIIERDAGPSTGGRRPILLTINHDAGLVLGLKLTETQLVAALTDLGANVVDQRSAAVGDDRSPEAIVARLAGLVDALRSIHAGRRVLGIGLGLAGVIDRNAGICRFHPYLNWRDVPLRKLIEDRLGLPVVIENDVNTLALAEHWFGAGLGADDFLVVTLGRGVGLGMILDGRLYRGGFGGAGEFGHVTVVPDGPRCDCGKAGCLEAFVADPALRRELSAALGGDGSIATGIALARRGDARALAVFEVAGRVLGGALAWLVNVFHPPLLIVGGEGASAAGWLDLIDRPMRDALRAGSFDGFADDLRIVSEPWGDDAWARGAASLMLEELFRPPLYRDDETRIRWPDAIGSRA